jgi:hypothetical protein
MSLSPRIAFQIGRRGGLRAADELVISWLSSCVPRAGK